MSPKEKAAKVLDTPEAALQNSRPDSTPDRKRLATLTARAAIVGITLHATKHDCVEKTVYVFDLHGIALEVTDCQLRRGLV
ncbi:MAG: hypothetical protein V9E91_00905 [Burkholderiaceae bacterium]